MNDRMDEKNDNNMSFNNVLDNEDIEGEEESDEETDEESDNETVCDEEEDNEEFDEESDENSSSDEEIDNQLNCLQTTDVLNTDSEPTCYICLNLFSGQEVGSPDTCDAIHYFCLDCIEEWSKQINTCPVDRKRFTYIIVRREIGSNVIMKLPIVQNIVPEVDLVPEDVTFCEICGRCDREDRLLLCDGCDFGYHCECLSPPIETIPIEEWFCPDCYERLYGNRSGNGFVANGDQRQTILSRVIARTQASEAVRQRILARRTQRKKRKTRKRKTRKTYRKRKTKRKTTTTKTGKKRKTRRRKKRRTKKSVFASSRLPAADARKRIASKLGLGSAPKSPFGLPSMKNLAFESIRKISDLRAAAGISNLSMFGSELDTYDPRIMAEDEIVDIGGDGLLARSRVGRLIHSPLKKTLSLPENHLNSSISSSSIDILSEIMSSQAMLHTSSRDVTINRDGSLHLNRNSVLPVRNCPNSGSSSPQRTPPSASKSPPRTDTNSNSNNSFNYSFGGQSSAVNNNSNYCPEDIGSIKPSVNQITTDVDDSKIELYSDIESLGDNNNKDDSDDEEDDQKLIIDDNCNLKRDDNIKAKSAQISQTSGKSDQINDRTNTMSDTKLIDVNKSANSSSDLCKGKQKVFKTNSKSSEAKRRLSIKDLFGDSDDDEEDDSDIRQLLAEKGSINVHYPIKMSIVLKNSMNKRDTNNQNVDKDLNNSDKQLKNNDNNKESAVNSDTKTASDENKEPLSASPSKWKSIESNNDEVISCPSDANKWKSIEVNKDIELSEELENIEEKVKNLGKDDSIDVEMSESDVIMTSIVDKDEDKDLNIEEEEGEIRDDISKVRRCRHGRIRREKNKDKEVVNKDSIGVKSRQRSRSSDSKGKKRESGNKNDNNSTDSIEVETNVETKETKDNKCEAKEIESNDNENNEKIGWKKLSNTSKLRSYRDGKPKDEELLFREREVPKKMVKKLANIKAKAKDNKETNKGSKDSDRHRVHEKVKERRHEDIHNNTDAKHGRKHRSEERIIDERVRHKRKSDDILTSSAVMPKKIKKCDDKSDSRRDSRTRSTDESYIREKERRRHHHKKHKHSSSSAHKKEDSISDERGLRHHRKHHSKKTPIEDDLQPMMSGTTTKILRDHSSYADVTPLDSKEIYAEGDRIVINVNFKRDNKVKLETEDKTCLISEEKKSSISEQSIGHKISSKKDDTIYWASPPPNTSITAPAEPQTKLTTVITVSEDNNQSVNASKTTQKTNEKSDSSLNESVINKKDNKAIDELRFLPRSLHQSDIRLPISGHSATTFGPHTPEGDYDENQFMPTPTQDESQSPLRSNSITSSSSSQSSHSSPTLSINKDNDVYDPEAPLQSPVDHLLTPVTSTSPQKKSVSLRTPLSPKENMRPKERRSPARRPPSAERLQKFSPKDIPKSSPASSSSHSIHSPFKSPSVLPQRQQMKSSPQKPSPVKSTSLMPPPVLPSLRPSVTSSIAVTAAAIASINPTNLAQLLQMAQSLKPTSQQSAQQQQQQQQPQQQQQQQPTRQTLTQRLMSNNISQQQSAQHQNHALNRDHNEVVDMDVESPSPPQISSSNRVSSTTSTVKTLWDQIIKSTQQSKGSVQLNTNKRTIQSSKSEPKKLRSDHLIPSSSSAKHLHHRHQVISVTDSKNQLKNGNKLDQLTVLDDVPSSAVEMAVKEKFIKKLNRQERVIEEVKLVLKPHYQKRTVTKEEYKEILRKSVPKICHSKSGEINPVKIKSLIEGYIKRFKYLRKKSKKLPKH